MDDQRCQGHQRRCVMRLMVLEVLDQPRHHFERCVQRRREVASVLQSETELAMSTSSVLGKRCRREATAAIVQRQQGLGDRDDAVVVESGYG